MPLAKNKGNIEIDYLYEKRDESTPPVIFLNGSIFNQRQWLATYLPAFRDLTQDRYSHVLYDYQGIGKSSSRDEQFTLQGLADELLGLIDYLKIKKAHLFGFTGLYPDRVMSLAGYGIVNLLGPKLEEEQNIFSGRLEALKALDDLSSDRINSSNFKRVIRTIYTPAIFQKTYSELNLKERIISWFLERRTFPLLEGTPIRTLELLFRYWAQDAEKEIEFYSSCIKSIGNKPVLLLSGNKDRVTPIELAKDLAPRLENSKLVKFEGFEHISPNIKKKQGKAIMFEYTKFLSDLI
ncbi:MAG: alpha/beta hydrolase [Candidatus Hodarchaeales archaeon]|jgi:pimeloyl-ACP methyl ester carboxylesterase